MCDNYRIVKAMSTVSHECTLMEIALKLWLFSSVGLTTSVAWTDDDISFILGPDQSVVHRGRLQRIGRHFGTLHELVKHFSIIRSGAWRIVRIIGCLYQILRFLQCFSGN